MNKLDVSYITDSGDVSSANAFNMPLDDWDTSKVQNMVSMFHNARSWAQSTALGYTSELPRHVSNALWIGSNGTVKLSRSGSFVPSTSLNQYCSWGNFICNLFMFQSGVRMMMCLSDADV